MENKKKVRVALNDEALESVSGGDNVPAEGEMKKCDWCGINVWCADGYTVEKHKEKTCVKRFEHQ